jgi:hypothetical protein
MVQKEGETMRRQASHLLLRPLLDVLTIGILVVSAALADLPQESPQAKKSVPAKGTEVDADDDHHREVERMVSGIEVEALIGGEWIEIKRIEKPLLYHDDPTRAHTRGSLWGWGLTGRPVALLELWQNGPNKAYWNCGLTNTSGGKLRARLRGIPWWQENESDVELKEIPGAPVPAGDSLQRQRQLKLLAQKFTAHEFWDPNNSRYELRRLERPLRTYRDEAAGLLDGGMYIISNGTNPEIMVAVEARVQPGSKAAPVWQFAVGRLSHSELHVEYDGKEVFSGPRGYLLSGPNRPYWVSRIDTPLTEPNK